MSLRLYVSVTNSFQESEPSYCCFTTVAICITLFSAGATFLIANHMYTGMPCHDEPSPSEMPAQVPFLSHYLLPVFLSLPLIAVVVERIGIRIAVSVPKRREKVTEPFSVNTQGLSLFAVSAQSHSSANL